MGWQYGVWSILVYGWLFLNKVIGLRLTFFFFACLPLVSLPLCEKTHLSFSIDLSLYYCQKLAGSVWVCFGVFCCIQLIFVPIFLPIIHNLNYCSCLINFDIVEVKFFSLHSSFQDHLTYSSSFAFLILLKIIFIYKKWLIELLREIVLNLCGELMSLLTLSLAVH
jgi:hypothetical protein